MGVAELKKVELYYHKSVREEIAKTLQHSGVCQIIDEVDGSGQSPASIFRLSKCEEQLAHIRYLFRSLGNHYTDPVSSLDRMMGERPVLSVTELARLAQESDLGNLAAAVKKLETNLNELRLEISQHKGAASTLAHIRTFPYPLSILSTGTRTLKGLLASMPSAQLAGFKAELSEDLAAETEVFVAPTPPAEKEVWIVVMYERASEQKVLELCTRNNVVPVELPAHFNDDVTEECARLELRIAECEKKESEDIQKLKAKADEWMPTIQKLSDYWNVMLERERAMSTCGATDQTIRTCLWVPTKELPRLQKKIEAVSPMTALVASDPTEEDSPPTLLSNKPVVQPFEILTNLYSPPPYGEIDPTPYLTPFFFLFFGMCLGDAGYAIVMLAAIWILFKKYRRIPKNVKDFILLFAFGAVSTFLYGIISGSFFGDFIDAFFFMAPLRSFKNAIMLVDPMQNPMQVLGISLFIGLIHLMFGLGIAAYDCIRKKNYVEAAGDKISWIFFVVGLALVLTGAMGLIPSPLYLLGKIAAILGAVTIFWYAGREKKGIFSKLMSGFLALYGSTSYLGDVLSYSRLLALGFGSAVIGMIINLLGGMAAGIPYIGWIVAIAVIAGGHLFGLLINLLGAFVHSLRLQYVEFFGKFYAGGGIPFKPLSLSTQYIEIAEQVPES